MCGIAGIFNTSLDHDALEKIGKKMVAQLNHRGPDGNAVKILKRNNTNFNILLTHNRLSIIDLSQSAAQPMSSSDGKLWIVFNGEIYNYQEIRNKLLEQGVKFCTHGDTEVILAAYQHWGISCFSQFNGMWALALWDSKEDCLILSRDRLGKKPLYYSEHGQGLIFASEPKVIVEQRTESRRLNIQAISDYFSYRYVLGGGSFFSGINSVEAGTHLIIKNNHQKRVVRYWDLPVVTKKVDPGEKQAREQLESLLQTAVDYRMIADVPLGAFLSGGLDSSILVALMSAKSPVPVKTYTIGFKEEGFNEFEYANEVAQYYKTKHREITLNSDRYLDSLQVMLRIKDAPLAVPNEIALHELSKVLKQDITVVLSGEGADELFGGYGRIFRSAFDYMRVVEGPLSSELMSSLLQKYSNLEFGSELDHFLSQYSYLNFASKGQLFTPKVMSMLGEDGNNRCFFENLWQRLEGLDLHEKYMWIFQKVHLEGLLGRLDSATMSASVEGRSPFIDHRLIEAINALPLHYKLRWKGEKEKLIAQNLNSNLISEKYDTTKYLLRTQYQDRLPARISQRAKIGFPVPLGQWLSGPLRQYAKARLLDKDARSRNIFNPEMTQSLLSAKDYNAQMGLQVWMMINVEDWMRAYDVQFV